MIHVHFLPTLTTADELAGGDVVVIDVLRASTTIICALASGAREVIPCLEVDEARSIAAGLPPGQALLGGEREGLLIEGFHFGNSPIEYTRRRVEGKTIVFTTTNGTRAMMLCRQARRVLVGAFVNLTATVDAIAAADPLHLLCGGTNGQVTREDVLFTGAVVQKLLERGRAGSELNDEGQIALDAWMSAAGVANGNPSADALSAAMKKSHGGRNLRSIGMEGDIDWAAHIDRFTIVPALEPNDWKIKLTR